MKSGIEPVMTPRLRDLVRKHGLDICALAGYLSAEPCACDVVGPAQRPCVPCRCRGFADELHARAKEAMDGLTGEQEARR